MVNTRNSAAALLTSTATSTVAASSPAQPQRGSSRHPWLCVSSEAARRQVEYPAGAYSQSGGRAAPSAQNPGARLPRPLQRAVVQTPAQPTGAGASCSLI